MLITLEERYTDVQKLKYPEGEWWFEPDEVRLLDEETLLPCLIRRGPVGSLCGYVGIFEGHPAYWKHYDEIDVRVHGGLTFADSPREFFPYMDIWIVGFDCAHYQDLTPGMLMLRQSMKLTEIPGGDDMDTYRNISYVKKEILSLIKQLNQMK